MEFVGYDGNKVIWEVVDYHVVEEETDHDEIGLKGFDFNLLQEDGKGFGIEGYSEFPYLLMPIKLWPEYLNTKLNMINMKVDEDNGKAIVIGNGRYQKVCRFSSNGFWNNIVCLISAPTFGLGGSSLREK